LLAGCVAFVALWSFFFGIKLSGEKYKLDLLINLIAPKFARHMIKAYTRDPSISDML
jgi:hypothetical protein